MRRQIKEHARGLLSPGAALSLLLLMAGGMPVLGQTTFISENPDEFYTTADVNGDSLADIIVVDRATGAYRIAYRQPSGEFVWASARSSGMTNVSGVSAGTLLSTASAALVFAQADANRVNIFDAIDPSQPGVPIPVYPPGLGPSLVTAMDIGGTGNTANDDLLVGSVYNGSPAARFTGLRSTGSIGPVIFDTGTAFGFARGNAVLMKTGGPRLFGFVARGNTADTFNTASVESGAFVAGASVSALPLGVDYVHGNFNGSALAQFLFYAPGQATLLLAQVQEPTAGNFTFSALTPFNMGKAVKQVFVAPTGAGNRLLVLFGQGEMAGIYDFDGVSAPVLAQQFQADSAERFTGAAQLGGNRWMMLSSVGGGKISTDYKIWNYNGGTYLPGTSGKLSGLNRYSGTANVLAFQNEPFVSSTPNLLRQLRAGDWSSAVTLSGGQISAIGESFLGGALGLANPALVSLGPIHTPEAFGIDNQYRGVISLFTVGPALGEVLSTVSISPPAGSYATTIQVSFTTGDPAHQVYYRVGSSGAWTLYDGSPFWIYDDATVSYYAQPPSGGSRTPVQSAAYHFTVPLATRDSDGDGVPDYVELGQNTDPNDPSKHPDLKLDGGGAFDVIVTPRPLDGTLVASTLDATGAVATVYSLPGSLIESQTGTNLFLSGVLTPSVALSNLVADASDRLVVLGTEQHYDVQTPATDKRIGREMVGLAPIPNIPVVSVPYTFAGGSLTVESANWLAAAQAAIQSRPLLKRQLDRYDTLAALLLEAKLASVLLDRTNTWATNITLFPFRTDDAGRVALTNEIIASIESMLDATHPGYLLQPMLANMDGQVRTSSNPSIQALASVATEIYRISSALNNASPQTYPSPVNTLRDFIGSGVLHSNYLSVTTLSPATLTSAANGAAAILASIQARPTTTATLRVRSDTYGGSCTLLETTAITPVVEALFDSSGQQFQFAQTFQLPPGTLVEIFAYTDASAGSCSGTPLEVITATVQSIPLDTGMDTDGNLLVDSWEMQFFGHLGNLPDADPDGDGRSNYAEMLAGTDPNDPQSYPPLPPGPPPGGPPPGPAPVPPYYTIQIQTGLNLIANQLDHGSNTLTELMPYMPDGCVISKYDNAAETWIVAAYDGSSATWTPGNVTLNPGEGAFLLCPTNLTLFFHGTPHVPVLPVTIPNGVSYLLSRQTNDVASYDDIVGSPPSYGATLFRWTGSNYATFTFLGSWSPVPPAIPVGEAVWISPSGAAPVELPQTYKVPIHAGLNLIANQLDHGSNMLSEILAGVPDGSVISKFDNGSGNWAQSVYSAGNVSWSTDLQLNPGEGAFLQSPTNFLLTFHGNPHVPVLPVTISGASCYLLSRQTNDIGTYDNIAGNPPANGASMYRWSGSNYENYAFSAGLWTPFPPAIDVGEAVWICLSTGAPPSAITQSYTINLAPGNSLIANQLDHGSNTAAEVFMNTGQLNGCQIIKYNCAAQPVVSVFDSSSPSGFSDGFNNPIPSPSAAPGEGFFFNNQSGGPLTLTLTGTPHVPVLPPTLPCGNGYATLLGRQTNGVGNYTNIIGGVPQPGAQEQIYNGAFFATYTFTNGGWAPSNPPALGIGQAAVFVVPTNADTRPPAITQQPQSLSVTQGNSASFSVAATGAAPLRYQWRLNGSNVPGGTGSSYSLTNVQVPNQGTYSVRVTNTFGAITSNIALLTVVPQTYSYTVGIGTGYNLLANQLDHGSNMLNEIMPAVPDGCVLAKYGNSNGMWLIATYSSALGAWSPGNLTLGPGEGAFLRSPTNFMLTLTGSPHVPVLPVSLPTGVCYLLSRQTNDVGSYDNIIGAAASNLAKVYKWNPGSQSYQVFTKTGVGTNWTPSTPGLAVGESAWFQKAAGPGPASVPNGYSVGIVTGLNLIANQLDHGSNTLNEILPAMPDGSVLYKYDNASASWSAAFYNAGLGSWTPGNLTLAPGEGAFLQSPSNFFITFTGTPHVPVLPITNLAAGNLLLSRQTNAVARYSDITGIAPQDGAAIHRWNSASQSYDIYQYFSGYGWYPGDTAGPVAAIGEALWVSPLNITPPRLPASYTIGVRAGFNLIANQLDHGSNMLNEIMPVVPDGCVLSKYDNANGTWCQAYYSGASNSWIPATLALSPGEGAFLQSPASFSLEFHGTPHVPVLPITNAGACLLLSRQTNDIGTYENIFGASPGTGAAVYRWSGSNYSVYGFTAGVWTPSAPAIPVGEAVWICPGGAIAPQPNLSYRVTIHPGLNLIANQLDHGSNMLDEVFSGAPDGSVVSKYNNSPATWSVASYSASSGMWSPPGITLNPGEGAFLQSPGNATLLFTGRPHVPVLPVTIPAVSSWLLSRQTNDIGSYTNIVGTPPTAGTKVYRWTGSSYAVSTLTLGSGWDVEPIIAIGEAVWISPPVGGSPQQIFQSYTVNVQPGLNLIANQLDHGSNMLGEILAGVPGGSLLSKYNPTNHAWSQSYFNGGSNAWIPNLTLSPGEGAFLESPTNLALTFRGNPHVPVLPIAGTNFANTFALLSRQTNDIGTWDNIVGIAPTPPIEVLLYRGGWLAYPFDDEDGDWEPSGPAANVGEAVVVSTVGIVGPPPYLYQHPSSLSVTQGGSATFSVSVAGTGPFVYQWMLNGAQVSGATNSIYTLLNVQPSQSGNNYSVIVTGPYASVTSSNSLLTVAAGPGLLSIRPGTNAVVLVWSDASYHLQASPAVGMSAVWSNLAGASPVVVPVTNTARFFRLVKP